MEDSSSLVVKIPEGESGKIIGRLTDENIQAIASVYALPEAVRKKRYGNDDRIVGHLARSLGVSPAFIRRAKRDRRVRSRLWDGLTEALDYLFPTLIYYQVELAMPPTRDTKAIRFLAEIIGRIKQHTGVNVNVEVNNGAPTRDGGISEDVGNLLWLKALVESGEAKRLLEAIPAEFVEVPPSERIHVGAGQQPQP
jgi:hypothetical protein